MDFCDKQLHESPHAKKYHKDGAVWYNEKDFIEYLNNWIFPDEPSVFIETLEWINSEKVIFQKYNGCDWLNFQQNLKIY